MGIKKRRQLGARRAMFEALEQRCLLSTIQFAKTAFVVDESDKAAVFTVTREGSTAAAATVQYALVEGSAKNNADFKFTAGTLTFKQGVASQKITVPIVNDALVEGDEAFALQLSSPVGAGLGATTQSEVTIIDNDSQGMLSFSAGEIEVAEGGKRAVITVTRTGGSMPGATVRYSTRDGSAKAGVDYKSAAGTLTFGARVMSKTFSVPIVDDTLDNADRSFSVALSGVSGAKLGEASEATVTIKDDDVAGVVELSSVSYSVNEAGKFAVVTVTRAGGAASGVTAKVATSEDTARAGLDYTESAFDVTFGAKQTSAKVSIPILNDTISEPVERFFVTLSDAGGGAALGGQSQANVNILDDDLAGVITLDAATYSAKESGGSITVTVKRTGGSASGVGATFRTTDATATGGLDFGAQDVPVVFAAKETTKRLVIPILSDDLPEGNETFKISLDTPVGGAALGTPHEATATIFDDDSAFDFSQATYKVREDQVVASIFIVRTGDLSTSASVGFRTTTGSATAGKDYTPVEQTVSFPKGVSKMEVGVPVMADLIDDGGETVGLQIGHANHGVVGAQGSAVLTINNPSSAIVVSTYDLDLYTSPLGITGNEFRITNGGDDGSFLHLLLNNQSGFAEHDVDTATLAAGQSVVVHVTTQDFFKAVGTGFVTTLKVIDADEPLNYANITVQTVRADDALIGTWAGAWSGTSEGRNNPGEAKPSHAVGGTWTLQITSLDFDNLTATGSLHWVGTDAYFEYTIIDGGSGLISAVARDMVVDRTLSFGASNATISIPNPSQPHVFRLVIDGVPGAPNPSDAFYGPYVTFDLDTKLEIVDFSTSHFATHPYNPNNFDTGLSTGPVYS